MCRWTRIFSGGTEFCHRLGIQRWMGRRGTSWLVRRRGWVLEMENISAGTDPCWLALVMLIRASFAVCAECLFVAFLTGIYMAHCLLGPGNKRLFSVNCHAPLPVRKCQALQPLRRPKLISSHDMHDYDVASFRGFSISGINPPVFHQALFMFNLISPCVLAAAPF